MYAVLGRAASPLTQPYKITIAHDLGEVLAKQAVLSAKAERPQPFHEADTAASVAHRTVVMDANAWLATPTMEPSAAALLRSTSLVCRLYSAAVAAVACACAISVVQAMFSISPHTCPGARSCSVSILIISTRAVAFSTVHLFKCAAWVLDARVGAPDD